ncbi:glycolate dehydrogenase [Xanthomonas phage FoX3]|uniref:Glycolate dehydrogenase n=1 Tax=Xanthomonas phage FoX3 TaxID=2723899 RepID=A0A858NPN7_9CAUD|nr:endonuclease VII [Xanthomonas phage FoX3]QJB21902.1 glycolate dehydrogenase [Xanthomonas phage FoX3]
MNEIISKAEAKAQGLKRYFTGKPCPNGHVVERQVSGGGCVECTRANAAAWYAANADRHRANAAAWRAENPERQRANVAAWRAANPERKRANVAAWRAANPEKASAHWSNRRARKAAAIPADWSDFDQFVMEEAAAACKRREEMTGYAWHVDHMIPLAKGGLHCATNIQVIPASMNMSKGDKLTLTERMEWIGSLPGA